MDAKEQIPQVQNHEFFQVFATYGQTMGYVQSFEAIPKLILSIYNYFEQEKAGSLDDEAFEKIFSEHDHSTLGRVLKALECRMGKVEANVKEDAVKMLDKLRLIRNDLAHTYLVRKEIFMKNPEGRSLVIAQLRGYSASFKIAIHNFGALLNHLLNTFVGSKQTRYELSELWNRALQEAMETTGLKYFREKLQSEGVLQQD